MHDRSPCLPPELALKSQLSGPAGATELSSTLQGGKQNMETF